MLDNQPVSPRLLNPQVPRDLEIICLKCLEKEPPHRYESAQELTDDLDRFLQGELIHASSINLLGRATRALMHSQHEEHFHGWGLALILMGVIIFLAHVATYILSTADHHPLISYWIPRVAMFMAMLVLLWFVRPQSILPTGAAERPIWAVWIGYLLAIGTLTWVIYLQGEARNELFSLSAILSGFGFFAMGSHLWGGSYLIGCAFLAAAPLLAIFSDSSAFWFGTLWGGALLWFGVRYWRRGGRAQPRADSEQAVGGNHRMKSLSPNAVRDSSCTNWCSTWPNAPAAVVRTRCWKLSALPLLSNWPSSGCDRVESSWQRGCTLPHIFRFRPKMRATAI